MKNAKEFREISIKSLEGLLREEDWLIIHELMTKAYNRAMEGFTSLLYYTETSDYDKTIGDYLRLKGFTFSVRDNEVFLSW